MRVLLINGSPKPLNSASQIISKEIKKLLPECDVIDLRIPSVPLKVGVISSLINIDCVVLCFPNYRDSVPSSLLTEMINLGNHLKLTNQHPNVYAFVVNGFYEGKQAKNSLDVVRNWSARHSLEYKFGIGLGGGEIIPRYKDKPIEKGFNKNLSRSIKHMVKNILWNTKEENAFVNPAMPKLFWRIGSRVSFWNKRAEDNGLKVKDIRRKITI